MTSALVAAAAILLGGVASVLRYLVSRAFAGRSGLPLAVLTVNVIGSGVGGTAVGLATAGVIGADLRLIFLGGLAGGLTTFSTWSTETIQLVLENKWRTALVSVVLNLAGGVLVALACYLATTALV